jgi:glycosyltransferase involved in cell wall biosynthesis
MNVLFVTVAWPRKGDRNLYSDLLHEFVKWGHTVCVAHADEQVSETTLTTEDGIKVLRIATSQIRKAGKLKKALSLPLLGFRLKKGITNYYSDQDFDLIIGHTPPITLSGLMRYLKKKHDAFFYLLLKDIWPHSSVDLNIIRKNGLAYKFFRWHEKRIYNTADVIGCMSPYNISYVLDNNLFLDPEKVEECPNTISPSEPVAVDHQAIRQKYGIPSDATLFIFSGNLSKGHGLGFYLDAIENLQSYSKAYFAIGGSGTEYSYLKREINKRELGNVFFYQRLPADDFEQLLAASDVGVILLDSRYTVPQFPSRLLAYLDARKAVLCAINSQTDIGQIVEAAECGISTIHGQMERFIAAIKELCENEDQRQRYGQNAHQLLMERYTSNMSYDIIMNQVNKEQWLQTH